MWTCVSLQMYLLLVFFLLFVHFLLFLLLHFVFFNQRKKERVWILMGEKERSISKEFRERELWSEYCMKKFFLVKEKLFSIYLSLSSSFFTLHPSPSFFSIFYLFRICRKYRNHIDIRQTNVKRKSHIQATTYAKWQMTLSLKYLFDASIVSHLFFQNLSLLISHFFAWILIINHITWSSYS